MKHWRLSNSRESEAPVNGNTQKPRDSGDLPLLGAPVNLPQGIWMNCPGSRGSDSADLLFLDVPVNFTQGYLDELTCFQKQGFTQG